MEMNVNATMRRLQTAVLQQGLAITIGRTQFYSADQKRFIHMISLSTKVFGRDRHGRWKEQNLEIIRTPSQTDALLCMVDIYKAVCK